MINDKIMPYYHLIDQYYKVYQDFTDRTSSDFGKKRIKPKDISVVPATPPTPKGMKRWDIDGYRVEAVTKKAAIKKINKLKSENNEQPGL
jgi:hypothetical protein